ncbi:polysaccharide export protein [Alcanivorax sp. MM125-6]|nr:polysaccharide export protein [Alcanivorax sp. MM125-6]
MKTIKLPIALAGLIALTGCAFAPGPHYSNSPGWFSEDEGADAAALPDVVEVHQISTAVLTNPQQRTLANPDPSLMQEPANYDYEVGPGDVLQITIWDHPELTIPAGSMRSAQEAGNWVHNDGTIFYPYVGKIQVAGMRVTEIRDVIADRIAEYIENPQVDVSVAAFRSQRLYVTGAVMQPGAFPVTNVPTRLLDAVNAAGGLSEQANWSNVTLSRDGKEYTLSLRAIYESGDKSQNVLLKPGDVVHVARNDDNKVFVLGEVMEPQPIPMTRTGLSLAEALSASGGFMKQTADASGIFVMRRAPEGSEHLIDVYQLNAKNATALVLADNFPLHQRDIVYVTAAPISRWNRVIQNLLPTTQAIFFAARADSELEETGL